MAKSRVYYFRDNYEFILKDGDPFPPTGIAPGSRILTLPSGKEYFFTGDEWTEEPEPVEVAILGELREANKNFRAFANLANQLLDKL